MRVQEEGYAEDGESHGNTWKVHGNWDDIVDPGSPVLEAPVIRARVHEGVYGERLYL